MARQTSKLKYTTAIGAVRDPRYFTRDFVVDGGRSACVSVFRVVLLCCSFDGRCACVLTNSPVVYNFHGNRLSI